MSIYHELEHHPIGSIAVQQSLAVNCAAGVREVVATMQRAGVDHVLVFDGQRLAGIFTERDLLLRAVQPDGLPEAPVSDFMTPEPTVLEASLSVSHALGPMVTGHYRHLPIADGSGGFIGVLTAHTLFQFLAELLPDRILNLPPRPHQTLQAPEGA